MTNAGSERRPAVRSSPLMLMVLVLLAEAPMHPYEMQRLMVWRGKDQVVRVQRGSLYPAVERLAKAGLIEPLETERAGRRPERTVYQLTEQGRDTAETWLATMIRTVRNEYPDFPAALSFIPMLSAAEARDQLLARRISLGKEIAAMRSLAGEMTESFKLPRLFVIEDEYRLAMLEAEHSWVGRIIDELTSGELYWDRDTITAWAQELQARMGSFAGVPRRAATEQDLPP
ncbi:MAG: PadR family transcriptional regulator [Nakamurella sp.]